MASRNNIYRHHHVHLARVNGGPKHSLYGNYSVLVNNLSQVRVVHPMWANIQETTLHAGLILCVLAFSQGCAEILAEAACAAGADQVHIGRYIAPTRSLSRADQERCMRAGTCHCIGNGTCFRDEGQENTPWWWSFQGSPVTIDCQSGACYTTSQSPHESP